MKRFTDIDRVRDDLKAFMPLDQFIELVDNKPLQRVSDTLYKKHCTLDSHPTDDDGTRDSTPSFTVSPQKELWYCFGCGHGGDRIQYLEEVYHIEHIEAIKKCAEISGFDLTPYWAEPTQQDIINDNLFRENAQARDESHKRLLENETALNYLLGRGMSMESIERFKLGYSDTHNDFNHIPNSLTLKLNKKNQFLDAILFPITDAYGRMRYFQSRPFNAPKGMKYIGTDESHPLFDDNERVFGLDHMRKNIIRNKGIVVGVEGAPDAIACNQHDILAIGSLGTTFNDNTIAILDKYRVAEFILLYDGDKAGRNRSISIAEKFMLSTANVRLKIAVIDEDMDPDEYLNAYGPQQLRENVLDKAKYAIHFIIDMIYDDMDTKSLTAKIDFMEKINKYIISTSDKVTLDMIISHVAKLIDIDPVEVKDYYVKEHAKQTGSLYVPHEEEIVLSGAMRDMEKLVDVMSRFRQDDWYLSRHRKLYEILKETEHTDPESLHQIAKNLGYDEHLTLSWLEKIYNLSGNFDFCVTDMEDKLIRRRTIEHATRLLSDMNDLTSDPHTNIDKNINGIYRTTIKKDNQIFDAQQQVDVVMNQITHNMENPVDVIGLHLGPRFQKLSKGILGLERKTLTVVAANQSVGKTMLCQNWAMWQATEDDKRVLWITLEMDYERMTYRHLAMLSGLDLTEIRTGNLTAANKVTKLDPAAIALRRSNFFLSERGHNLDEALSIAKYHVMVKKVDIVYVDYLQLQHADSRMDRHRELGHISKAWKQFSRDMDIPVVAISQLSKESLKAETAEAEHGAGSYEIAQDSDNYITIKEKDEDEINERGIDKCGNITFNISKNRMGEKTILIDGFREGNTQRMFEL